MKRGEIILEQSGLFKFRWLKKQSNCEGSSTFSNRLIGMLYFQNIASENLKATVAN